MPRSLIGQVALLLGVALLVAQLVNFGLILNERQKLSLAQTEGPAIARFVAAAADYAQAPAEFTPKRRAPRRRAQFSVSDSAPIEEAASDAGLAARLRQSLVSAGIAPLEVRAATATELRPMRRARGRTREAQMLLLSAQLRPGEWLNARLMTPRHDPWLTARLAAATLLLYLIVLGATLFIAARLTRPLRDLTLAAEHFGGRGDPVPVEPRGPDDLRRPIEAFNAMNRRVVALLDEKDRMLGAIGHDLRTPLASLRIRAEAIEPEEERLRMVATIEEMTTTLEDILVLARFGRARSEARSVDVTALADAVVEEFRELGHDVALESSERHVATVQPNLLRRAIRNLIDNAVKYGGSASVAVRAAGGLVSIEVEDRGPGLEPEELEQVLEPFYRVEASRNRETGGSGLGLAIARTVAESHGGTLTLANRAGGGLVARLTLAGER